MRAMRTQRKNHLHQQLVRILILRIPRKPVLTANLAEFARPVSQNDGASVVSQIGQLAALGAVETPANKPASSKLVIGRGIHAKCPLLTGQLLSLAPDQLAAPYKRMVNGSSQRLPAQGRIDSVQICKKIGTKIIVTASIRNTDVQIRGLSNVLVAPQMRHCADILPFPGFEDALKSSSRVTPEHLARGLEKQSLWRWNNALNGKSGIVNAIFTANQIGRNQRPVDPR